MEFCEIKWVWQQPDWPYFQWNNESVQPLLRRVRIIQGILLGKVSAVNTKDTLETALNALLENIITSWAIEGEQLNVQSVRSSLAKRLGITLQNPYPTSERSEGVVKIMLDAIENLSEQLTLKRLFLWHRWLFPNIESSIYHIRVGELRGNEPMQVVSGRIEKPIVHFEAPPKKQLNKEIKTFMEWFNSSQKKSELDPLLRAAICHFWFVTLHPFDDGNGRITRALTDLALAEEDRHSIRLYAMSTAILSKRKSYYQILEQTQRGTVDITQWIIWFLETLEEALQSSINKIESTLLKSKFWQRHQLDELSKEQIKILNLLLGSVDNCSTVLATSTFHGLSVESMDPANKSRDVGLEMKCQQILDNDSENLKEGITASKYQKITKVSKATATRHLADLLIKDCLEKLPEGGRSTRYIIKI